MSNRTVPRISSLFPIAVAIIAGMALLWWSGGIAHAETPETCGADTVVTLYAGQTIDAGTVTVGNDEYNLYVTFSAQNGWLLSETHLHVADTEEAVPQTKKGNPKVGNFAYQTQHDPAAQEFTYTIAKADLAFDSTDSLVVAAHAVVVQQDSEGNEIENETDWADGDRFTNRGSWATYFGHTWQECVTVLGPLTSGATETAFAFGGTLATCFLDIDQDNDGNGDFNRWGWTNGGLAPGMYSFEIYAGAGRCDLSKGAFVGMLTVFYDGASAFVSYDLFHPYVLEETHLYIGSDILAEDVNGNPTVAPGQYPTIHDNLGGVGSDSYTVTGLSGAINVVAHVTVAGFEYFDGF